MDNELEPPVHGPYRQDQMPLHEILRDQRQVDLALGLRSVQIDVLQIELSRESLGDVLFLGEAGLDHGFADALAAAIGNAEGLADLLFGHSGPFQQDLA